MVERVKSLVIGLLFLSLLSLLGLSMVLSIYGGTVSPVQAVGALLAGPEQIARGDTPGAPQPAAYPAQIAVLSDNGLYAADSPESYDRLYETVSEVYYRALGSAGQPQAIGRRAYAALFAAPAVYLRFDACLPLWLHHAWSEGTGDMPEDEVCAMLICMQGDAVALAVATPEGNYYLMETGASRLDEVCRDVGESNALFAGSHPALSGLDPDTLIFERALELSVYSVHTPAYLAEGRLSAPVLEAFGLRPYLARSTGAAGAVIRYIEGSHVLLVDEQGGLSLSRQDGEAQVIGGAPGSREAYVQAVEVARALVSRVWRQTESLGTLSLLAVDYDAERDAYSIAFAPQIGGMYLETPQPAAQVVIEGGELRQATVRPCIAAAYDKDIIPHLQYAAAARPDGQLGIYYALAAVNDADGLPDGAWALLKPLVGIRRGD